MQLDMITQDGTTTILNPVRALQQEGFWPDAHSTSLGYPNVLDLANTSLVLYAAIALCTIFVCSKWQLKTGSDHREVEEQGFAHRDFPLITPPNISGANGTFYNQIWTTMHTHSLQKQKVQETSKQHPNAQTRCGTPFYTSSCSQLTKPETVNQVLISHTTPMCTNSKSACAI